MSARSRPLFLLQVLLAAPQVRQTVVFVSVVALCAVAGFGAAIIVFAPTSGPTGSLLPLEVAVGAAAIAAGVLCLLQLRSARRQHRADFVRLARRLGEEKTARSVMRAAFRRVSQAVERAVPEILSLERDDAASDVAGPGVFPAPLPGSTVGAAEMNLLHGASEPDAQRARRLIRIARAAALFGGTDLDLRKIALAGPCAEVIEEYRRQAGAEREVLYVEDGGGDWLAAPLDRGFFVLGLRELLDNVFEHAGDWNRITVTTEPVSGAIVLRVRDDGRGMKPDALRSILMATEPAAPPGLGLQLVRSIVEAHGGAFRIESAWGQGTAVTLRWPTHP